MVNYYKYINSQQWKKKSMFFIAIAKKCNMCGSTERLSCHHKHYNTIGFERFRDIEILCWKCHKGMHNHMGDRSSLKPKYRKRIIFNGKRERGKIGISNHEAGLIGRHCIKKNF